MSDALKRLRACIDGARVGRDLDVVDADLAGASLDGLKAEYLHADRADLTGASLQRAHLMDADFPGARLRGADFTGATLWQCRFRDAEAGGARFAETHAENNFFQLARLEGADQALNELMGLQPSPDAQQKSEQVGQQLDGLRQAAAQQGQKPGQEGQPMPMPGGQQGFMPMNYGLPMDQRPRINTPGSKGEWNSRAMNAGKDY